MKTANTVVYRNDLIVVSREFNPAMTYCKIEMVEANNKVSTLTMRMVDECLTLDRSFAKVDSIFDSTIFQEVAIDSEHITESVIGVDGIVHNELAQLENSIVCERFEVIKITRLQKKHEDNPEHVVTLSFVKGEEIDFSIVIDITYNLGTPYFKDVTHT